MAVVQAGIDCLASEQRNNKTGTERETHFSRKDERSSETYANRETAETEEHTLTEEDRIDRELVDSETVGALV